MSTIQEWGNSLAIRIPQSVAGQLDVSELSEVLAKIEALVVSPDV